ncbi:DUF1566 domain-containing protein [Marinomonas rhizomae]|uniref:Uncharacterized protein DUF1566 n=1 Tax=Marinomonas rhizomae TaxID=491948 RepID=A0A366IZ89_9GAMM|nr:DUF1566 domain-containing protein [Marinomonas rhizomae]RBP79028.1 uncharacterized protein DUF1566 [Marinomonas rhizomae]RNF71252.1 DUF1566 domain-containing protein [Marinomonas rhizomae]
MDINQFPIRARRSSSKNAFNQKLVFPALSLVAVAISGCSNGGAQTSTAESALVKEQKVSFVLTDTMQESCFDDDGSEISCSSSSGAFYGQDAQYDGVKPSYTDNGNSTVTDNNTGMMWQKTPDYEHYVYDDAISYCEGLTVAGYNDWRLPSIKELYSIADFRGEIVDPRDESMNTPYLDTTYFDFQYDKRMAYIGQYWSSTKYTLGPVHNTQNVDAAFGFNFADGHIKAYETGYEFGTKNQNIESPGNFVRCVRGEENVYGVNDFVTNGDGTVTDKATGLMWQSADDNVRRNWQDSLSYAENAEVAGYSDWRMPNIKELQSIVKYGGEVGSWPAIDTRYFTLSGDNTINDPSWVWSSTTQGDFKYTAAYISFSKALSKKNSSATEYYDWHGAGAQRSDPKSGTPSDYDMASENATDLVMTKNYTLLVRNIK